MKHTMMSQQLLLPAMSAIWPTMSVTGNFKAHLWYA